MRFSDESGERCASCGQLLTPARSSHRDGDPVLSVVIPVHNEADQITQNLASIYTEATKTRLPLEVVIVDDGSTDGTWAALTTMGQEMAHLRALRLSRNFGKEAAICAGLAYSRGQACIVIDSDLQHPPEVIPEMVRLWRAERWDIVEGVKKTRGAEPLINRLGARFFYRTLSGLSGYDLYGSSDFKLLDRKVIDAWLDMRERNTFFRGMVSWLGFRRRQVTFSVPKRRLTLSRWSFFGLLRLAVIGLTAFSSLPLQAVTLLGGIFLLCAILFSVYALVMYFTGLALAGFTTVIILELTIGGVLMISLGIIGTYIAQIYQEVKYRPRYVVAERIGSQSGGVEHGSEEVQPAL
ncbi:MAG TPA: glycosyltransferase [Chthoniobacterales bacterium]|nr:glycosyltransferase [Chthoniobacterales bacterium]